MTFMTFHKLIEKVVSIELWRDSTGFKDDWFVEHVSVKQLTKKDSTLRDKFLPKHILHFPLNRWIHPDRKYVFDEFDSCLPQFDKRMEQRQLELEDKRKNYVFETVDTGLPRRVSFFYSASMCYDNKFTYWIIVNDCLITFLWHIVL